MQPHAVALAEVVLQPGRIGGGQIGDADNAQGLQPCRRLGADAVDAPGGQGPDAGGDVLGRHHGDPGGLLQVGAQLGQQLVGRHAQGARQPGGLTHGLLQVQGDGPGAIAAAVGVEGGEVQVDLVDAPILHLRGNGAHRGLEEARMVPVGVEVGGQQDGVRCQLGGLHQTHAGMHAQRPCLVGGGGDHASPCVVAQAGKSWRCSPAARHAAHPPPPAAPATAGNAGAPPTRRTRPCPGVRCCGGGGAWEQGSGEWSEFRRLFCTTVRHRALPCPATRLRAHAGARGSQVLWAEGRLHRREARRPLAGRIANLWGISAWTGSPYAGERELPHFRGQSVVEFD
jgi:hypothetical protein